MINEQWAMVKIDFYCGKKKKKEKKNLPRPDYLGVSAAGMLKAAGPGQWSEHVGSEADIEMS